MVCKNFVQIQIALQYGYSSSFVSALKFSEVKPDPRDKQNVRTSSVSETQVRLTLRSAFVSHLLNSPNAVSASSTASSGKTDACVMKSAARPAFIVPTASTPGPKAHALATLAALTTLAPTRQSILPIPSLPAQHVQRSARSLSPAFTLFPRRQTTPHQQAEERERRKLLDEAFQVIRERYVDERAVNWPRLEKRLKSRALHSDEQLSAAMTWLFENAHDPFTRYLTPAQLDAMKDDIDGEMCGVGIVFNAEKAGWWRGKRVVINHVVRNSPAADAGLMKGDWITAIDMISISRMSFDEATSRLLGKQGDKVLISFSRNLGNPGRAELNVLLTRRRFEVPTVSAERVQVPGVGNVAFLQLREFAANTAAQTRAAVRGMAGSVDLFVLDMRGNSGGLVDKAVEVAKVFLDRDRIVVRFVGRDGAQTTERCGWRLWRPRVQFTKEPIVILVDAETASASELVAAALRDNCRAVVVGNTTFGKGSVQAIVPLSNGAGVAVTVARYKTPRDHSIVMGKGLRPDLFKSHLAEDPVGAVKDLFGRGGARRLKWIVGRLGKCVAPDCEGQGKKVRGRAEVRGRRRLLRMSSERIRW